MSDAPMPNPTGPLQPAPKPVVPQGGGFISRLVAALLVVVITTFVVLIAGAVGLFSLGFTPDMPGQIARAHVRLMTAEALSQGLQVQGNALQTQVLDLVHRSDTVKESLDDLRREVDDLDRLRQELSASASQNATMVADAHLSRDAVVLFATAEAGRSALLDDLKRRSERVERFLQRLSDISSDTAFDLSNGTPVGLISPSPLPQGTLVPTGTVLLVPTVVSESPVAPAFSATPVFTPSPVPTMTLSPLSPSRTPPTTLIPTARQVVTATP